MGWGEGVGEGGRGEDMRASGVVYVVSWAKFTKHLIGGKPWGH